MSETLKQIDLFKRPLVVEETSSLFSQTLSMMAPFLWLTYGFFLWYSWYISRVSTYQVLPTAAFTLSTGIMRIEIIIDCGYTNCLVFDNCSPTINQLNKTRDELLQHLFVGKRSISICPTTQHPLRIFYLDCLHISKISLNVEYSIQSTTFYNCTRPPILPTSSLLFDPNSTLTSSSHLLTPMARIDKVEGSKEYSFLKESVSVDDVFDKDLNEAVVKIRSFFPCKSQVGNTLESLNDDYKLECKGYTSVYLGGSIMSESIDRPSKILDILGQMGGGWGLILSTLGLMVSFSRFVQDNLKPQVIIIKEELPIKSMRRAVY